MNSLFQNIALALILLPLAQFLAILFFSKILSKKISLLATSFQLLGFAGAVVLWFHDFSAQLSVEWFSLEKNTINWELHFDAITVKMMLVVYSISLLVHVFSMEYMKTDRHQARYFSTLGFFVFAMVALVVSHNLLLLFTTWELVGFASYLLIGHWNDQPDTGRASAKAFLMNRVADVVFLIGLFIIYTQAHTFSISELQTQDGDWRTLATLCIFAGVIGKSAQFPLFSWLPTAMVGPTPVSALIHAATMVAAGIYVLVKISFLLTPIMLQVIAITGMITTLIGSMVAAFQFDLKKILAFSTISQLGLMIVAIGMQLPEAAFLHLTTHAFFKAGLFLCAGYITHQYHQQDIRHINISKKDPLLLLSFLICLASLCGVPFTSGFLSKEMILSGAWEATSQQPLGWIPFAVLLLSSCLTCLYSSRLIGYLIFKRSLSEPTSPVGGWMRAPILLCALASLWIFFSTNPFYLPNGKTNLHWPLLIASTVIIAVSILGSYWFFKIKKLSWHLNFISEAFYIDQIYSRTLVAATRQLSLLTSWMDVRIIDRLLHVIAYVQATLAFLVSAFDRYGVDGVVHTFAYSTKELGRVARGLQQGKIQLSLFWALFAVIIFLFFILF